MKIKSPASSANLGPGFDCFGLAWQLYDTIEFTSSDKLIVEGCDAKYQNADNLAYVAYKAVLEAAGKGERPVRICFADSNIPVSRGLGSSAALIVAGVLAANELNDLSMTREELFAVASAVEGHPDNVAPALFGGLTVSTMDGARAVTAPFSLSGSLHFTALVPDFELSTERSRAVLPQSFSRSDAIFNISRAALLLKALESGDGELIALALQDKIHQPYRKRLISGYENAEALALRSGAAGVCISGAGSTMLCVSTQADCSGKIKAAMAEQFPRWRAISLTADMQGATVSED